MGNTQRRNLDVAANAEAKQLPPMQGADELVPPSKQVKALEDRISALLQPVGNRPGYEVEFLNIDFRGDNLPRTDSSQPRMDKNRYLDIIPVESSRVTLKRIEGVVASDYINANYIKGLDSGDLEEKYIATQGPLPHTCEDFWRMVWEQNAEVVLMLANTVEMGMPKCHNYWETDDAGGGSFGQFRVERKSSQPCGEYEVKELTVTHAPSQKSRHVMHFHFKDWPDQGTPSSTFNSFVDHVERVREDLNARQAPLVVHCSAGIGRTGVFCVVHLILARLRHVLATQGDAPAPPLFDVSAAVYGLRTQRHSMVQTADQYLFCYRSVLAGAKEVVAAELGK